MKARPVRTVIILLACYLSGYAMTRFSGSIAAHTSQGYFELEFRDGGILGTFPAGVRTYVGLVYWPLMWLEQPLLRYYVPEPSGG